MPLHDARETNASTRTHILRIIVPGEAVVSFQSRAEYIELAARMKHDGVKEAIYGDYRRASEK